MCSRDDIRKFWEDSNYSFSQDDMKFDFESYPDEAEEAAADNPDAQFRELADVSIFDEGRRDWDDGDQKALEDLDALYAELFNEEFEEHTTWVVESGEQDVLSRNRAGVASWAWAWTSKGCLRSEERFTSMSDAKARFDGISPIGEWMENRIHEARYGGGEIHPERRFVVSLIAETTCYDSRGRVVSQDETTRLLKAFDIDDNFEAQKILKNFVRVV
jgi:hypothetical protein